MEKYQDVNCEENSSKYHTGEECVENYCDKPAGTAWSPYFCVDCNIKRMEKIDESLGKISSNVEIDDGGNHERKNK